jgi:hypothetical protein
MAKATRVLSTPHTNTPVDTTRRRFLTVAAVGSIVGAGSLAAAAAPNVVHIGRLRAERDADDTARFMALFYQLEPADQIMISDRLRSMVEIDAAISTT